MMIREPFQSRKLSFLLGLAAVLVLLFTYFYMSHLQHQKNPDDTTMPGMSQLVEGWKKITAKSRRGEIWIIEDSKATFSRLFYGLFLAVVISVFLGVTMGCFATIEAVFTPIVSILAKLTPTAMLAVFFVIFGTGSSMFISMIVFGIVPTLTQNVYLSAKKIPKEFINKAYTLGGSTYEVIWFVIVKQSLPVIINSIRLSIGPAMVFLIAAEMVVGDVGFGYRIRIQSRLLAMNVVYLYLFALAAFGYTMDFLLTKINQICFSWYHNE